MTIADGGGGHADARLTHRFMEAEIGHHRTDHGITGQLAFFFQGHGAKCQDTISGYGGSSCVGENNAVCIAIERNPDVGTLLFHDLASELGIQRADTGVDIDAIRIDAELHHLGTEFLEDKRSQEIAGAMSAIDDDLHAVEVGVT